MGRTIKITLEARAGRQISGRHKPTKMRSPKKESGCNLRHSSSAGSGGDGSSSNAHGPNMFIGLDGGHAVFTPWGQGKTPGATPHPPNLTPLPPLQYTGAFVELANIYADLPADPFGL